MSFCFVVVSCASLFAQKILSSPITPEHARKYESVARPCRWEDNIKMGLQTKVMGRNTWVISFRISDFFS
jgi:hypothetical protein